MLVGKALPSTRRVGAAGAVLAVISGCAAAPKHGLASAYPLDRARATVQAAESGDVSAVDRLVTLLEDRDSAVRMYAIAALERLCGETYGYRYYDPEEDRAEAVARWRTARQRGEVTVRADSRLLPTDDSSPTEDGGERTEFSQ